MCKLSFKLGLKCNGANGSVILTLISANYWVYGYFVNTLYGVIQDNGYNF